MVTMHKMPRVGGNGSGARAVLAAFALIFALGCGDSPVAPPKEDAPAIRVQNSSAKTVTAVYYSDCASDSWGDDRLNGTIAPGGSQTFTDDVTNG